MKVKLHKTQHAFGGDRFGQAAEKFARFFGTPKFLISQTLIVIAWMAANGWFLVHPFDPMPFILLNLAFSTQAAYAAPLILLAQTRQADRDKAIEESASQHREEVALAHAKLLAENTELTQKIDGLLQTNTTLTNQVKELLEKGGPN